MEEDSYTFKFSVVSNVIYILYMYWLSVMLGAKWLTHIQNTNRILKTQINKVYLVQGNYCSCTMCQSWPGGGDSDSPETLETEVMNEMVRDLKLQS